VVGRGHRGSWSQFPSLQHRNPPRATAHPTPPCAPHASWHAYRPSKPTAHTNPTAQHAGQHHPEGQETRATQAPPQHFWSLGQPGAQSPFWQVAHPVQVLAHAPFRQVSHGPHCLGWHEVSTHSRHRSPQSAATQLPFWHVAQGPHGGSQQAGSATQLPVAASQARQGPQSLGVQAPTASQGAHGSVHLSTQPPAAGSHVWQAPQATGA
jgi:hypothetical protein